MNNQYFCFAFGIATQDTQKNYLEVYYPKIFFKPKQSLIDKLTQRFNLNKQNNSFELDESTLGELDRLFNENQGSDPFFNHQSIAANRKRIVTCIYEDTDPQTVPEIYLKLHLLSHRFVKPNQINLNGIFSKLHNLAWTDNGAIALEEIEQKQTEARLKGQIINVKSIDKFPQMADYVVPKGVRIGDASRVRLGAYLGEGTTIMHEGFVNFNAGSNGPNMVEGRISAGVFVDSGSDLGGGCSTMGTLSGGNNIIISVGKDCLIGANAGLGIPLGDRCTIESGLYLTAGSKVMLIDEHGKEKEYIKAAKLSGISDLLFRRNSKNGRIECLANKSVIQLNDELHSKN